GGSDGPEDVDAAFAEIVADLEREGIGSSVVEDDVAPVAPVAPSRDEPTGWRVPDVTWVDAVEAEEDDHFVPPEPPPLPRLRAGTLFGILLLAVGVLLLAGPQLIGLAPRVATPLSLVSLAAGIGWLVLRTRRGPPDSDRDDGAQV
ncbi:MAG TPA: hypothetical protein VGL06_28150, partial [Pseudonocardiaceae bacterium]